MRQNLSTNFVGDFVHSIVIFGEMNIILERGTNGTINIGG